MQPRNKGGQTALMGVCGGCGWIRAKTDDLHLLLDARADKAPEDDMQPQATDQVRQPTPIECVPKA